MLYDDAFLVRLEAGLRTALPNWGLAEAAPLRLLTISENATFVAEDDAGGKIVLRVHRPGYHSDAEILSELAWIEALRQDGVVATPRPIPAEGGAVLSAFADGPVTRRVVAFEHMTGVEPEAGNDLAPWYRELGAIAARLHAHSRAWPKPRPFERKVWDYGTTIGDRAHWGDFRRGLGLTGEGRAVLERTAALLKRQTDAYGAAPDRFGLVHCDMRPANLLVDGDRLGVIDFDDCGISWFAYDFAAAASFLEAEPFLAALMAAWVEGYRSVAPFSAEDEAALPMFVMLRRLQLTAWIASHSETPTARETGAAYTLGSVALAERYLGRHPR